MYSRYDVLHITILYHMQSDDFPGRYIRNSVEHLMLQSGPDSYVSDRGDYANNHWAQVTPETINDVVVYLMLE